MGIRKCVERNLSAFLVMGYNKMKLTITRIEEHVVTCEFEDCGLIDIGRE